MPRQYKRSYSLKITGQTSGLTIEGLRVAFEVTKDLQGAPNLGRFQIYNLSGQSRAKIETEFDRLTLNVGYENNVKLLFDGDIKNVLHARTGEDSITTIFAGDGQKDFEQTYTSFTLGDGAKLGDVINRITTDLTGNIADVIQGVNLDQDKLLGLTLADQSSKLLDSLAKEFGFDWSIQNRQINIIAKDDVIPQEFKISAGTGMIGSPSVTEIGADVTFLINPEILPGRILNVESVGADVNYGNLFFRAVPRTQGTGRYKIVKINYVGDTHSDQWLSTATCRVLK